MHSLTRAIAHIDCDCFFAAVELLDLPHLKGKPVFVCNRTDTRGIVVSATYEARVYGIKAGTPVFKAKTMCPQGILVPCHFEKYEAISLRLMQLLSEISPDTESCSIDEAFVDLTGLRLLYRTSYAGIGELIQKKARDELGITVSVGIAPTKLLAKLASDFKKPAGLTLVTEHQREDFLAHIKLSDIPGVGSNTENYLLKKGFSTALDLAKSSSLSSLLGKRGQDLWNELNGISINPVRRVQRDPKSLSHTRTFPDFLSDAQKIHSFSLNLLISLMRRLRRYQVEAGAMEFFLLTKNFQKYEAFYHFEGPTDEEPLCIEIFKKLFKKVFKEGEIYRKSGFFLTGLCPQGEEQGTLFDGPFTDKNLGKALDKISEKYGVEGITRGSLLKKSPRGIDKLKNGN